MAIGCSITYYALFSFLAAPSSVLDYLNAQATTILERMPSTEFHPMKQKSSPSTSPFDFRHSNHNVSLLSPNAHSNFMYANWIGLHAKAPEQTSYLFNIPGNDLC